MDFCHYAIEFETKNNKHFRNVLCTTDNLQLVLISLKKGQVIPREIHPRSDQFVRVEQGELFVLISDARKKVIKQFLVEANESFIIPKGTYHEIQQAGTRAAKFYTIYSEPVHEQGLIMDNPE